MNFETPLLPGRLIKRYKRFLADVTLDTGEVVTAHCPNTGSMKNCQPDNGRVWLRFVDDPKRKLKYTWELVEIDQQFLACINTGRANGLVREAIENNRIPQLPFGDDGYTNLKAEVRYGEEKSRIDFLLQGNNLPDCYLEVKNVTLLAEDSQNGQGFFPDAKTERGTKHLRELARIVEAGHRAVLFYNVAHTGIQSIEAAKHIDPVYTKTLNKVLDEGVEVMGFGCSISPDEITITQPIPFLRP